MSNAAAGPGSSPSDDFSVPLIFLNTAPKVNSSAPASDSFSIPIEYIQDSRIPVDPVGQPNVSAALSAVIIVENLNYFSADHTPDLLDVSFQLYAGKLACVVGGNEHGASALLHLLALEKKPTKGRLVIQSRDIGVLCDQERLSWARTHIITIRRKHLEPFTQTGYLHVSYWLHYYRDFSWNDAKEAAKQALLDVGLPDEKHVLPIEKLSLDEKVRVSIAKAYPLGRHHYSICLCDDIFGGLDKSTAIELMCLLREVTKRDIAVIVVAHRPDLQANFDQVLVMQNNRLIRNF